MDVLGAGRGSPSRRASCGLGCSTLALLIPLAPLACGCILGRNQAVRTTLGSRPATLPESRRRGTISAYRLQGQLPCGWLFDRAPGQSHLGHNRFPAVPSCIHARRTPTVLAKNALRRGTACITSMGSRGACIPMSRRVDRPQYSPYRACMRPVV
ncbi:hypothetical protein BU16DRAFT_531893 [Lophium mytilinum]|uniref:Uncharacterized protein n=1 Tax=Lophium mytilinum TaxID=390894 RepID=A0A6A6QA40_9PEZI|nr:hypothetical protein BU16DRAFT_531893 [Lophium mytilinum]